MPRLMRVILLLLISLLGILVGFIFIPLNKPVINSVLKQLKNYKTSDGAVGFFEKKETLSIFNLSGSYDEMGQQYGALAYNQLNELYQNVVPDYFSGLKFITFLSYTLRIYYAWRLDDREKSLLHGMEKTSGLTYKQLLSIEMLPTLITLYSGFNGDKLSDTGGLGHCSFLSVWGKLSQTKSMLVARNLDLSTPVTKLDRYHSLVIYNPNTNDNSVAAFGFIGFIPGFTWFNSQGMFSEYNDGRRSVPGFNVLGGYIGLNTAFYGMFSSKNTTAFIKHIADHPAFVSNFTAIVNKESAYSIEHSVKNPPSVLSGQTENYLFFTNLYRTEFKDAKITMHNCIEKVKDTPSYACVRYHHIEKFMNQSLPLNLNDLKTFFYTPLDNGGVYQTGASVNYPVAEVTIHTLVGDVSTGSFLYSNHQNKDIWLTLNMFDYFKNNK